MAYVLAFAFASAAAATAAPATAKGELCEPNEQTIWSCAKGAKRYALCASKEIGAATSYLQYRAGVPARPDFVFPATRRPPKGVFKFANYNKTARVHFENAGYRYEILESIYGQATIDVAKGAKSVASIKCDTSTDTLTLNTTMEQFHQMGISEP